MAVSVFYVRRAMLSRQYTTSVGLSCTSSETQALQLKPQCSHQDNEIVRSFRDVRYLVANICDCIVVHPSSLSEPLCLISRLGLTIFTVLYQNRDTSRSFRKVDLALRPHSMAFNPQPQPRDDASVHEFGRDFLSFSVQHGIHCVPIDDVSTRLAVRSL